MMTVVIPVYRNAESLPELVTGLTEMAELAAASHIRLHTVFVVDGSPDSSHDVLAALLARSPLSATLVRHSRNFGSFAAIRTGLASADSDWYCVLAADLQEPPSLVLDFVEVLRDPAIDLAVGRRVGREDAVTSRWAANQFWRLYRGLINPQIPEGGVDVFGCTRRFRDHLLSLREANSSLVALAFWLGFDRAEVPYRRAARPYGRSAWSFRRKYRYLLDSIYAFTDLPITALTALGAVGMVMASAMAVVTAAARIMGGVPVPGYAPIMIAIAFFGALNLFALGVIGSYAWRAFENTKQRPGAIVADIREFGRAPVAPDVEVLSLTAIPSGRTAP
jgi:glycosyltransferase involved in cell wall biosynthesis